MRTQEARRQLSLFVPQEYAGEIEAVRRVVDPVQSRLIPAHVTLCREDELADLPAVLARLHAAPSDPVRLRFGKPERSSGHGLLLPCVGGGEGFHALRRALLDPGLVRELRPHITLAHPRNPKASGNSLSTASTLPSVMEVTFPTVSLIEQEGDQPWRVMAEYDLRGG